MREYTLREYQAMHGIKRIDFSKVNASGKHKQYSTDELICPYCKAEFDLDSEEIDEVVGGTKYQCPDCEKWFYAEGEISVNTWCTPIEDIVLDRKVWIEETYKHLDKCEEMGVLFDGDRKGCVEWGTYERYAMPLFENAVLDKTALHRRGNDG